MVIGEKEAGCEDEEDKAGCEEEEDEATGWEMIYFGFSVILE